MPDEQLPLFHPLIPSKRAPGAQPALWIRRFVLWQDIDQPPIRDFPLRRGLNVVVSPPDADPEDQLPASGHAAGKSLFCRMVRYCLGEAGLSDPIDASQLQSRFPRSAVGLEVLVEGRPWGVRRSLVSAEDRRARAGARPDDLTEGDAAGFPDWLDALQSTLGAARTVHFPDTTSHAPWLFVLAWLARDQECRFEGLDRWRHPDSGAPSPARGSSAEDRLRVLRIMLDLFDSQTNDRAREIARLKEESDEADKAYARLDRRFEEMCRIVANGLDLDEDEVRSLALRPPTLLDPRDGRGALIERAQERIRRVSVMAMSGAPPDPDSERRAALAEQIGLLSSEIEALDDKAKALGARRDLLEPQSVERQNAVRRAETPTCPFDGTRIDVEASTTACPLVTFPDPVALRRLADETKRELGTALEELAATNEVLAQKRGVHGRATVELSTLERAGEDRHAAWALQTEAAAKSWAVLAEVRDLLATADRATEARREANHAKDVLKASRTEENNARAAFPPTHLADWFDRLVRRVVHPHAKGSVSLDGNGFHTAIDDVPTRRSVALNALQVLLFDLAAMLCASEGHASMPAFLLHDSPREGDLDPHTYHRVFRALAELDVDPKSAAFQYIVTTTTEPPAIVADRVRLTLGSAPTERRLLQADL